MDADQVASLAPAMERFTERFERYFKRTQTFGHFQRYMLGLMADLDRKSVERIALFLKVAVRTLQEFLSQFKWDHGRVRAHLQRDVAERVTAQGQDPQRMSIGVIDASGHAKRGDKTPGVQRQYCGETGKIDNCVVGQHLLWTDNHAQNPFSCVLASDLYLPQSWADDRAAGGTRCKQAHIPENLAYRPKWRIAIEQVEQAIGHGVIFDWITFDEDYGNVAGFWFELDRLGQRGIGEVKSSFRAWVTPPACQSLRSEHASRPVQGLAHSSPAFRSQAWRTMTVKESTRGPVLWQYKAAMVHLVERDERDQPRPTDRRYWLIVARQPRTGEVKYFVSNASATTSVKELLQAAFARWHVEKWFERAKQQCGMGAFEVRTYTSLMRHWLCATLAMMFLAEQTLRLRGEKSADHIRAGGPSGGDPAHKAVQLLLVGAL